jgi:ribose transport system ATP-binding protein
MRTADTAFEQPVAARFRSEQIVMDYGATRALAGVDLVIGPGEVHGLLGANGAGKSSLIKIIAGLQEPTSGTMQLEGEAFAPRTPAQSMGAGVRVAHQELAVVGGLTVKQNLAMGARFRERVTDRQYAELYEEWGIPISMSTPMHELSPGLQAAVSLSRSLVGTSSFLLLDEPTASLGPREVTGLFRIIRRRAAEGAAIVFVSHRLGEVSELCEKATVLRNGRVVSSGSILGKSEHELAELIAPTLPGEAAATRPHPSPGASRGAGAGAGVAGGTPMLRVSNLRLQTAVADVSLTVHPGEIVGIAGLVGAGRTELVEALMGLRRIVSGSIEVDGKPFRPKSPYYALRHGVALVPEERARQALFPQRNIVFNASTSRFRSLGRGIGGWRSNPRAYLETTTERMSELHLKASSLTASIMSLSGGNQQKVVLGRVLSDDVRLLLLDEPTRGVDVGARRDFQAMIRRVADRGVAIVYISSELAELRLCDRIQVMAEGVTTVTAPTGDEFDEDELTRLCFIRATPGETT